MVARSMVHRPAVLFMDEPTAGLDPQSRLALWEILRDLNRKGQTILLTTHYMEEADQLCDRVAIMDHGRILALGTPSALKSTVGADTIVTVRAPAAPEVLERTFGRLEGVARTRSTDGAIELHAKRTAGLLPRIAAAAEREGVRLADLAVAEPSLETVFINLTGKDLRD